MKSAMVQCGYEVYWFDIKPNKSNWHEILAADIIFICTPEQAVESITGAIEDDRIFRKHIVVVRSTVPPGTCEQLSKKHGFPIFHNPEFLREAHSILDAVNPPFIVLGGPDGLGLTALTELYSPFRKPIFTMTSTESEMLKLWQNAKLACNISFANEMKKICDLYGVNSHLINNILTQHPVYPDHPWMIGKSFGGRCLPKDLDQLISIYPSSLLTAVKSLNEKG